MTEPMIPTGEQTEAVDTMMSKKSQGACLMGSEVGTGKTLVSVEFAKRFGAKVTLIIAPLQTLGAPGLGGWHGTFDQQEFAHPFRRIDSDLSGRAALADYQWNVPGVYFIGQEYFVRLGWKKVQQFNRNKTPKMKLSRKNNTMEEVWKNERLPLWGRTVPDLVIFDEVHRAQNGSSVTNDTLMGGPGQRGGMNARYKIGASGTPYGNSFDGAWAVTRWLWPHLVDSSIYVWRSKWCEVVYDHFAVRNQKVVGELVEGAFFNSLPCYIRIESDLDIEMDAKDVIVTISPEQRRIYTELENSMVAWIQDNPMVTSFPIVKRIRQRQATLGVPTLIPDGEGGFDVRFALDCESVKIDSTWSILEKDFEHEPTVIFTDSQIFADVIVYRLNSRYGEDSARKWSGKVTRKLRDQHKQDFIEGKFKYLVAVIRSSGTGTDGLQFAARNMLYFSSDDSRIDNEQSIGRLVRRGQTADKVRLRRLIAKDTIDSGQLSKHMRDALRANKILKKRGNDGKQLPARSFRF